MCIRDSIEAVPHIARRRERSPLNPAEIDRLVNELSIISDAIQKVGINGREKKILADFMQGALYSRLIERNIPSTMPMFLDNHQGRDVYKRQPPDDGKLLDS